MRSPLDLSDPFSFLLSHPGKPVGTALTHFPQLFTAQRRARKFYRLSPPASGELTSAPRADESMSKESAISRAWPAF